MKIFDKKSIVILLILIFVVNSERNFIKILLELETFLDTLLKQISVYEIVLLNANDNNINYNQIDNFVFKNIISQYATRSYNFQNLVMEKRLMSGKIESLLLDEKIILFICLLDGNKLASDRGKEFIGNLRAISLDTYTAKFVLFVLNDKEERDFEDLLDITWENLLINVCIYEIFIKSNKRENNISRDEKYLNYYRMKSSWNIFYDSTYRGVMHSYNPFTRIYLHEPFDENRIVFPDKTRNLYQYVLRVGLVDYPPYSDVTKTDNSRVQIEGPGGELIKTLIKHLNFTIIPEIGTLSQYGILLPNGSVTGLMAKMQKNELDVIAFGSFILYTSFIDEVDRTIFYSIEAICAVVPLIPSDELDLSSPAWMSVIIVIVLVILLWLFSLILKPRQDFVWHPLNIALIILGISVAGQPRILRERFVYGSAVVVSVLYSSSIFAQLASVNFVKTSFKPLNTLEELTDSGLIPVLHPNLYNVTFESGSESLLSFGSKSYLTPKYADLCPLWLWEHANVTCILGNYIYYFLAEVFKGHPDKSMKLAQPCFWSAARAFTLRKTSPFTDTFSKVIIRVVEAGFLQYAKNLYVFNFIQRKNISIEIETSTANNQPNVVDFSALFEAFVVMFVGVIASVFIFIGECFIFWYKKRIVASTM